LQGITVVLLCAGSASRFENRVKKQWLRVGDEPLWKKVENDFRAYGFTEIIIVARSCDMNYMQKLTDATLVIGGDTRQQSLQNALKEISSEQVLVSDVARCCFDSAMIDKIIATKGFDCVVPYLGVSDTVYLEDSPVDRDLVKLIQTPQLSKTDILKQALQSKRTFTDDSSAIAAFGGTVGFVQGSAAAHKITHLQDLKKIPCLKPPSDKVMCGTGFDTHAFEVGKQMVLCGVEIESGYGFKAHSDGDVGIHAIIDALLGACQMGDIGELYPDTDKTYEGADSKMLLQDTVERIVSCGFEIHNIDITIIAQKPKINPYKKVMLEAIQDITKCKFVNIKATTAEKMGYIGRCEGVAVQAVATVGFYKWERE
jgi:2-C-methyl-D-erythritol 4-phosphate cytidylyltransferase/2-C-methyl-D-erythritol 2,4-cyclodiphosphate synthase